MSALLCQSRARHPPLDIDRVNFPRQSVPCQIKGDWKTDFGLNPTSFTINYLPSLLIGGLASQGDDPQIFRARGGGGPKIPQLLPAFLPSLSLSPFFVGAHDGENGTAESKPDEPSLVQHGTQTH